MLRRIGGHYANGRLRGSIIRPERRKLSASRRDCSGRIPNFDKGSNRVSGWWSAEPPRGRRAGLFLGIWPLDELEEGEIVGQLLLGDAAVRPQPGAQQRPDAFHGVDVNWATLLLPHCVHRTPSGQRRRRTVSKHLASSTRNWRLIKEYIAAGSFPLITASTRDHKTSPRAHPSSQQIGARIRAPTCRPPP
jgi:hypothetical protein